MKKIIYFFIVIVILFFIGLKDGDRVIKQNYTVNSDKISLDYTIVQISDFHSIRDEQRLKKINDIITLEKVDFFAITGDYISEPIYKPELDYLIELNQIAPVYYINGNHDNDYEQYEDFKDDLVANGINVVVDNNVVFNGELNVFGTQSSFDASLLKLNKSDDKYIEVINNDTKTFKNNFQSDMYNIVLAHNPAYFEGFCDNLADLVLTGHTHGGLWRIPFFNIGLIAPEQGFFPKYDSGLFTCNNDQTTMIISTGLEHTSSGVRRIFTPAEVVIVNLKSIK